MESDVLLDRRLAFAFLRFTLGLNILMHGAVRLPILSAFVSGMLKEFAKTLLPALAVRAFAYSLPFVEALVGLLLLLGLWTRGALLLGELIMASLVFGTALLSDWNTLAIQLLYVVIYAALLAFREYNGYSLDALMTARGSAPGVQRSNEHQRRVR
jgi:thiosulfate dehydrogenase (quinone) large subunit